jgi:hypothetical protein
MKKVLATTTFILLCVTAPAAAANFQLYGSWYDPSDVDDTFGGGLAFGVPLGATPLQLTFRGTYYQELTDEPLRNLFDEDEPFFAEESLEVLPIEATLQYNFADTGTISPWIGAGVSYFLLDSTRRGVEVDDETGWHVSAGSRFGQREGVNFFAEALYRSTESTVRNEDEFPDDEFDIVDEVDIDLDGISVNAGLLWRW